MTRLTEMIRLYLAANNIDNKTAARDMKVNESTLSRFLSGKSLPDAENLMKILTWITKP